MGKLEKLNMGTTFKYMGMFFAGAPSEDIMEACNKYKTWLKEELGGSANKDSMVDGVVRKCLQGFTCANPAAVPTCLNIPDAWVESSRANHETIEDFKERCATGGLTGNLATDVYGISPRTCKAMAKCGMNTTWQMFGIAMMCDSAEELKENLEDA